MKKLVKKLKIKKNKIINKIYALGGTVCTTFILAQSKVYAVSGTESIDAFINFACDWLTKIRRGCCSCRWSNVCTSMAT